jgi:hypothetical protein
VEKFAKVLWKDFSGKISNSAKKAETRALASVFRFGIAEFRLLISRLQKL